MQNIIDINPKIQPQIIEVGLEKTPIIIIDNFALDTSNIKADAAKESDFTADAHSYYPGIRSTLPKPYVITTLQTIYRQLYHIYQVPKHLQLKPQDIYYSLITKTETELSHLQSLPHFDTSRPYYFAILHYLAPAPHGNTGLFRHKSSQFERITEQRVEPYLAACQQDIIDYGEPDKKYCIASDERYELYHQIEYKENRLVIYPGNLLHSTLVDSKHDINADIEHGRLTANIFIEFK